jgi:hypothetical protein
MYCVWKDVCANIWFLPQERGYFSKSYGTWGLNLKNEPYRQTIRPDELYAIKERHLKEVEAAAGRRAAGPHANDFVNRCFPLTVWEVSQNYKLRCARLAMSKEAAVLWESNFHKQVA